MLIKLPKHKVFNYQPRFYDPDKDKIEERKKRLNFRYHRKNLKRGRSSIYWLIILIIVLYFYIKLSVLK